MRLIGDADILVYKAAYVVKSGRLTKAIDAMNRMIDRMLDNTMADSHTMYLTSNDKSNFRFKLATIKPYKGTAKRLGPKPDYYYALRDYLQEYWDARVITDIEADDAMGIDQMASKEPTIIGSIDKDMDMIPKLHYNIDSEEVYESSDPGSLILSEDRKKLSGTGLKWFYAQMLMGDAVDNIPGLAGCGKVGAYNTLEGATSERDMALLVFKAYCKRFFPHQALQYILEISDLLWILRESRETFIKSNHVKEMLTGA